MLGRSHLVIGTGTAAVGTTMLGCPSTTSAVVIGAAAATAKLPDVDIKLGLRHRGMTHTVIATVLLALLVAVGLAAYPGTAEYAVAAAVGVATGYGMHLVADACTVSGIPAFMPMYSRDVHLLPRPLRVVTGGWREMLLVLALVAAAAFLIYHHARTPS